MREIDVMVMFSGEGIVFLTVPRFMFPRMFCCSERLYALFVFFSFVSTGRLGVWMYGRMCFTVVCR